MDGFVVADTVRLLSKQHFTFPRKYIENFLSVVCMRWMRALPRSNFRDVKMELFSICACFKDKAVDTFDIVSDFFFLQQCNVPNNNNIKLTSNTDPTDC